MRMSRRISRSLEAGILRPAGCPILMKASGERSMPMHFRRPRRLAIVPCVLAALAMVAAPSLAQQTSPSRVRGTIESVDGDMLAVKSRNGDDVRLHMAGDLRVVGIARIALSDIKVG